MSSSCCFVCGSTPVTDLYLCDRGWHLLTCADPMCSVTYTWVMSAEDHLACRQMLNEQRRKLIGGDDKYHPVSNNVLLPRWDPNR